MEYKLWALLLLIADRRGLRVPRSGTRGWILDAGAHDGATSVMLCKAMAHLQLQVLALEPLAQNAKIALQRSRSEPNLNVQRAGLGDVNGTTGHYPIEYDEHKSSLHLQIARFRTHDNAGEATYPIVTIDALFGDGREHSLVLAHLDLEGQEAAALRGANATIRRDRPVLTVETFPNSMAAWHRQVMALLEAHNYAVYTVDERVGWPPDGRNHVAIPREDRRLRYILDSFFDFSLRRRAPAA
jgi:FkbM family methyltransferase